MWNSPALRGDACLQLGRVLEDHERASVPRPSTATGPSWLEQLEGHAVAVVADHAVEVADAQGHRAHAGVGGQQIRSSGAHWL